MYKQIYGSTPKRETITDRQPDEESSAIALPKAKVRRDYTSTRSQEELAN